jgi:hypothetical protein
MTANFCGFFFFLLQNSGLLVLPWGLKPLVYIFIYFYLFNGRVVGPSLVWMDVKFCLLSCSVAEQLFGWM